MHELNADRYLLWQLGQNPYKKYKKNLALHPTPEPENITVVLRVTPKIGEAQLNLVEMEKHLTRWESDTFLPGALKPHDKERLRHQLHDCWDFVWCAQLGEHPTPAKLAEAEAELRREVREIGRNSDHLDIRAAIARHPFAAAKIITAYCPENYFFAEPRIQLQLANEARKHLSDEDKQTLTSDHAQLMALYEQESPYLYMGEMYECDGLNRLIETGYGEEGKGLRDIGYYETMYPTHAMRQECMAYARLLVERDHDTNHERHYELKLILRAMDHVAGTEDFPLDKEAAETLMRKRVNDEQQEKQFEASRNERPFQHSGIRSLEFT